MKKKVVSYECTWNMCKTIVPEDDDRIQAQLNRQKLYVLRTKGRIISCPECGSAMRRRVNK